MRSAPEAAGARPAAVRQRRQLVSSSRYTSASRCSAGPEVPVEGALPDPAALATRCSFQLGGGTVGLTKLARSPRRCVRLTTASDRAHGSSRRASPPEAIRTSVRYGEPQPDTCHFRTGELPMSTLDSKSSHHRGQQRDRRGHRAELRAAARPWCWAPATAGSTRSWADPGRRRPREMLEVDVTRAPTSSSWWRWPWNGRPPRRPGEKRRVARIAPSPRSTSTMGRDDRRQTCAASFTASPRHCPRFREQGHGHFVTTCRRPASDLPTRPSTRAPERRCAPCRSLRQIHRRRSAHDSISPDTSRPNRRSRRRPDSERGPESHGRLGISPTPWRAPSRSPSTAETSRSANHLRPPAGLSARGRPDATR